MTCSICKMGEMKKGFAQVVLTRGESTVIFKNVPALVCDDCGEYILNEETAMDVYRQAERLFSLSQEVAVLTYKKLRRNLHTI